jgi:hypothetical protein
MVINRLTGRGYARNELMIVRCRATRSRRTGSVKLVVGGVRVAWILSYAASTICEVQLVD